MCVGTCCDAGLRTCLCACPYAWLHAGAARCARPAEARGHAPGLGPAPRPRSMLPAQLACRATPEPMVRCKRVCAPIHAHADTPVRHHVKTRVYTCVHTHAYMYAHVCAHVPLSPDARLRALMTRWQEPDSASCKCPRTCLCTCLWRMSMAQGSVSPRVRSGAGDGFNDQLPERGGSAPRFRPKPIDPMIPLIRPVDSTMS